MNVNEYEKPQIKYVSLQNEEKIANTCWGYHGSGKTLYFDKPGYEGYASFQIGGSSCTMNLINVTYYWQDADGEHSKGIGRGDSEYDAMAEALVAAGGESGNPFKGEGEIVFDDVQEVSF